MSFLRKSILASLLVALLSLATATIASEVASDTRDLPDVAAPPGGEVFWIARSMRLNGMPMTIKSFTSPANAEEVLHYYERRLGDSPGQDTRRIQDVPWRILAIRASRHYITIRARDAARGSEGTIAVSPALSRVTASKRTRFPHPESMRVVNLQQYDDAGIEAEHISLVSARSPAIEARAFEDILARQGWQLLRSESAGQRRGGHIIEAQKAASLAFITVDRAQSGGDTAIVVVWRKS